MSRLFSLKYKKAVVMNTIWLGLFSCYTQASYTHFRVTETFNDREELQNSLDDFDARERDLDAVLFTKSKEWLIVSGTEIDRSTNFPAGMANTIQLRLNSGRRVVAGDCHDDNACAVIYDNWTATTHGTLPSCVSSILTKYKINGWDIKDIEVTAASCVFLGTDREATYSSNLDPELKSAIYDRRASGRDIESLAIGFNQEWALVAGHNPMYSGVTERFADRLNEQAHNSDYKADMIALGPNGTYLWYSGHKESKSTASEIGVIEYGLASGDTIWQRMESLDIPGVSVAIIKNTVEGPEVSIARGYGRRRADGDLAILAKTPFALASLSKYLGALTVVDQLEADAGMTRTTNLFTADILPNNGQLHTWRNTGHNADSGFAQSLPATIRGNNVRAQLTNTITLDRLMVHTANIVSELDGSSIVEQPQWANNNQRATSDWLFGRSCRNGCASFSNSVWQVDRANLTFDYDSGNYLVVQGYLEDRTGVDVHTNLQNRLFTPVGMANTSSRINLSSDLQQQVAWCHDGNVPQANMGNSAWPLAGGIWSSSEDYANAMIVALNQGVAANGTRILNAASVNNFILNNPPGQTTARGWGVDFDGLTAAEGTFETFAHSGGSNGTRALMCGNPSLNQGIVILVNSDSADARTLIDEIATAYLSKVNWNSEGLCSM